MRLHIVAVAFDAIKHAKVPEVSRRFEKGEVLVFLKHPDDDAASTVFALRDFGNRKDPNYDPHRTSNDTFEAHTEELPPPATKKTPSKGKRK